MNDIIKALLASYRISAANFYLRIGVQPYVEARDMAVLIAEHKGISRSDIARQLCRTAGHVNEALRRATVRLQTDRAFRDKYERITKSLEQ